MNIIEKAVSANLYFTELGGTRTTQDLYQEDLNTLNTLYGELRTEQDGTSSYSLLETRSTEDKTLQLKIDVVKHIVGYLVNLKEAKKQRAELASKRAVLKELRSKKELESLENLSIEDIDAQLAELA